ncbi:MAG: Uma2 family endonuclease [Polyangiaceae bacterium]
MGLPAEKPRRATLSDLEAVPEHMVAEIFGGVLHVFPRPSPPHAHAASILGMDIGGPFDRGRGGPGGWRIVDEPELHLGRRGKEDVLIPDLAGWRLSRMPRLPVTAYFSLAPDWVCEVLSPSTETVDRSEKMAIYAREKVSHAWLVHPFRRMLEVYRLGPDGLWIMLGVYSKDQVVRAEPFDAVELHLSSLWTDLEGEPDETPVPPLTLRVKRPKTLSRDAQKKGRGKKA